MSLAPLLEGPRLNEEQNTLLADFFEATGYSDSDLLSLNYQTRTFLTRNGGKYKVKEDGDIDHLDGPPPAVEDRFGF